MSFTRLDYVIIGAIAHRSQRPPQTLTDEQAQIIVSRARAAMQQNRGFMQPGSDCWASNQLSVSTGAA